MKVFSLTIGAGETKSVPSGSYLLIIESTSDVSIVFERESSEIGSSSGVGTGYEANFLPLKIQEQMRGPVFTQAKITSAAAQTIKVGVSDGLGGYAFGGSAVDINQGTSGTETQKSITATASAVVAGSTSRKVMHVRNSGGSTVALVANSATTFANAAIHILPGDEWREAELAGIAWYALCDTAQSSTLEVLEGV